MPIINDVEVKECEEYKEVEMTIDGDEYGDICGDWKCDSHYCEENPNCQFKQLKRLEKENANKLSIVNNFLKENNNLKKENGELKVYNEELSNLSSKSNAALVKARFLNYIYRQALEEIREMLKNEHPFKDCSCGEDIITKIDEVLR